MRNVPATECKRSDMSDADGNVTMSAFDTGQINKPGAFYVNKGVKLPGAAPSSVISVCCPCGCGVHTSVWADPPEGNPPSMKTPINVDYPGHVEWKGQLLNGVWTEDGSPVH